MTFYVVEDRLTGHDWEDSPQFELDELELGARVAIALNTPESDNPKGRRINEEFK